MNLFDFRLQMVQNPEARRLTKKKKQHIIPVLDQALSPPVQYRTELKNVLFVFKAVFE